jgi:hypothetical protein
MQIDNIGGSMEWRLNNDSSWQSIGRGGPQGRVGHYAVASNRSGRREVFVVDTDNRAWHIWQRDNENGNWVQDWERLGGQPINWDADIKAVTNRDGHLEAFGVDPTDRQLRHIYQHNPEGQGGWSDWERIDGGPALQQVLLAMVWTDTELSGRVQVKVHTEDGHDMWALGPEPGQPGGWEWQGP